MQKSRKPIDILFAATTDYLKYAVVTARSVVDRLDGRPVNIHFMYADIVHPIPDDVRDNWFEMARRSFDGENVSFYFYDITDKLLLLDGQNIGKFGPEISKTHYFYLLAPVVLPDSVDKVIYLDTDMIVNCDLDKVYNFNMNKAMLFAEPSGDEAEPEMFNSGFSVINLKMWREEDILTDMLSFGRGLPPYRLCDQNLLNKYFAKKDLNFVSKQYNVFPQFHIGMPLSDIGILHYVGDKPWNNINVYRCDLWWYFARRTAFYEQMLVDVVVLSVKLETQKPHHNHSFWWHLRHMKF